MLSTGRQKGPPPPGHVSTALRAHSELQGETCLPFGDNGCRKPPAPHLCDFPASRTLTDELWVLSETRSLPPRKPTGMTDCCLSSMLAASNAPRLPRLPPQPLTPAWPHPRVGHGDITERQWGLTGYHSQRISHAPDSKTIAGSTRERVRLLASMTGRHPHTGHDNHVTLFI